ncbi:cyclophilin-like fold protein [Nocardioides dongxiaopingii]|uniref:cyclophilin-like fold protein n=1 Tax=Nocardioides dongxiaopingii TaxID=2576036 RepID=UPI0010C76D0C|nr:cyclophilin-like fold protein [Nocardioides dongxiaopingii]
MSKGIRSVVLTCLASLALTALAACGGTSTPETPGAPSGSTPTSRRGTGEATATPRSSLATTPPPGADADSSQRPETGNRRLRLVVSGQQVEVELDDSAAARDLLAQLPLTVNMTDHGGVEKTGPLPTPLSLEGQPDGADPEIGDLGYYAPGNDLVLYHGDQSYFPGIVVLGWMTGDAADRLATIAGPVTVAVSVVG